MLSRRVLVSSLSVPPCVPSRALPPSRCLPLGLRLKRVWTVFRSSAKQRAWLSCCHQHRRQHDTHNQREARALSSTGRGMERGQRAGMRSGAPREDPRLRSAAGTELRAWPHPAPDRECAVACSTSQAARPASTERFKEETCASLRGEVRARQQEGRGAAAVCQASSDQPSVAPSPAHVCCGLLCRLCCLERHGAVEDELLRGGVHAIAHEECIALELIVVA